jgi:hypothetical protein
MVSISYNMTIYFYDVDGWMNELRVKLPFTPGVQAKVQLTSSIPIGAKVEISLKSLLGGKTEIGAFSFIST